ncbi:MAG: DUF4405 domain-containing protein [Bacteroidales bacterium]|jgi:uncharacterized integral membrane protein|nr:DUF4405 domain-containing protein [Bacteroidales bacterium]
MNIKNLVIVIALFVQVSLFAQVTECPRKLNCPFPGTCGLYKDADGDKMCDLGVKPAEPEKKIEEIIKIEPTVAKKDSVKPKKTSLETTAVPAQKNSPTEPETPTMTTDIQESPTSMTPAETEPSAPPQKPYIIVPIIFGLLILYVISIALVKIKLYKKVTHRKIWNLLLGITFLVSAILGVILAIMVNVQSIPSSYMLLMKYHVDFGIAMTVICFFHIFWHVNYFKSYFIKKKNS